MTDVAVYIAKIRGVPHLYKVGYSSNLTQRRICLRSIVGQRVDFVLAWYMTAWMAKAVERRVHEELKPFGFDLNGSNETYLCKIKTIETAIKRAMGIEKVADCAMSRRDPDTRLGFLFTPKEKKILRAALNRQYRIIDRPFDAIVKSQEAQRRKAKRQKAEGARGSV